MQQPPHGYGPPPHGYPQQGYGPGYPPPKKGMSPGLFRIRAKSSSGTEGGVADDLQVGDLVSRGYFPPRFQRVIAIEAESASF